MLWSDILEFELSLELALHRTYAGIGSCFEGFEHHSFRQDSQV